MNLHSSDLEPVKAIDQLRLFATKHRFAKFVSDKTVQQDQGGRGRVRN